jgi:rare lipoprotein A
MRELSLRIITFGFALMCASCAREPPLRSTDSGVQLGQVNARHAGGTGCSDEELRQQARSVLRGLATFYHDSLAGNPTVRVTRTDVSSAAVLCLTVNDRGPFGGKGRIIDVSRRAAERLGMLEKGVVRVRVDVL